MARAPLLLMCPVVLLLSFQTAPAVPLSGTDVSPVEPGALWFDGIDDYVGIDDVPGMDGPGLTLEAWILDNGTGDPKPNIMARRDPVWFRCDAFIFRIRADHGHVLEFGLGNGRDEWGTAGTGAVPVGQWTHVAASYDRDSGEVRLYINGQLDATARSPITAAVGELPLWLGADPFIGPAGRSFGGAIADVRVYEMVRSSAEIRADMFSEPDAPEPGLLLRWKLIEGGGQLAQDGSGNVATGLLGDRATPDPSDPAWDTAGPFG